MLNEYETNCDGSRFIQVGQGVEKSSLASLGKMREHKIVTLFNIV